MSTYLEPIGPLDAYLAPSDGRVSVYHGIRYVGQVLPQVRGTAGYTALIGAWSGAFSSRVDALAAFARAE